MGTSAHDFTTCIIIIEDENKLWLFIFNGKSMNLVIIGNTMQMFMFFCSKSEK